MGNEGQNIPNNTSGAERKRPWEIFSEEEKESIRKEIKHLDRNKKKKQKISKCKAAFIDIKKFGRRHKIIYIICILIFSASIMSVGFFSTSLLVKMISNDNIENAEALEEEPQNSKDNIFNGITLKNAPNPVLLIFQKSKIIIMYSKKRLIMIMKKYVFILR